MKVTLENTTSMVEIKAGTVGEAIPARIWQGKTDSGIPVFCFITRVLVEDGQPPEVHEQFARELKEARAPDEAAKAIPLRLIL